MRFIMKIIAFKYLVYSLSAKHGMEWDGLGPRRRKVRTAVWWRGGEGRGRGHGARWSD